MQPQPQLHFREPVGGADIEANQRVHPRPAVIGPALDDVGCSQSLE
jgi:hypothetical protein